MASTILPGDSGHENTFYSFIGTTTVSSKLIHMKQYCNFIKDEPGNMFYVSFATYCNHCHVDMAIQRAKEDACDTCVRLSIAVADPQRTHASDARTQRVA